VSPHESTQRLKVELWARNVREFCLNADLHVTFRVILHVVKLRHGTDGFTSPPKEGVLRIFCPKNPTALAGYEPANLGYKGHYLYHRHPISNHHNINNPNLKKKLMKTEKNDPHSNVDLTLKTPHGYPYHYSS